MENILVVDDHSIFRRGVKDILSEELPGVSVTETGKGHETMELVRQQRLDVVVLDINLPDKNGIEVLKEIKVLRPHLPVVILSLYPEDQYAMRAFKAGASGYLTKETVAEELITAIKKVIAGGVHVSQSLAEQLVSTFTPGHNTSLHQNLSDRELEVLTSIARGRTITEIADSLALSVKTVSTYKSRIHEKLNLKTSAELVRYAVEHDLVE